ARPPPRVQRVSPGRTRGERHPGPAASRVPSVAALFHVGPYDILGVLLEHLVDLVENRVHVVGELLLPLLDVARCLRLRLLGLLAALRGLSLTASVLRRHARNLRATGSSLGLTVSSPAGGLSNPEIGHRDQAAQ